MLTYTLQTTVSTQATILSCLFREPTHLHRTAGWSPLHHAGLLSPPTLVSFLLKHGASPLALTRRGLTPLDIITAHSLIPGREAVAFLIEEAMREQGWSGGRMALRRRQEDERARRRGKRRELKQDVGKVLGLENHWWGEESSSSSSSSVASSDNEPDDPGRGLEDGAWDRPMDMSYVRASFGTPVMPCTLTPPCRVLPRTTRTCSYSHPQPFPLSLIPSPTPPTCARKDPPCAVPNPHVRSTSLHALRCWRAMSRGWRILWGVR